MNEVYSKLTVIRDLNDETQDSKHKVLCRCECGGTVETTLRELKRGRKKSCGCINSGHKTKSLTKVRFSEETLTEFLAKGLTLKQMAERLNCGEGLVSQHLKHYGLKPLGATHFNRGERNGAKNRNVRERISNSIADLWEDGFYADRVDGMTGKFGFDSPVYTGNYDYRGDLSRFQSIEKCSLCGRDDVKVDVHHIDENHSNWLITNLEPLCVPCHQKFHYKQFKMPYASIAVGGHFTAGHYLPSYDGACNRVHAHGWKYVVTVRKRINPDNGMVMDFKELKSHLKDMESVLDHRMLNDIFSFEPTAENLVVWMWEYLSKRTLLKGIVKIALYESDNCYTEITYQDMLSRYKNLKSKGIFIGDDNE